MADTSDFQKPAELPDQACELILFTQDESVLEVRCEDHPVGSPQQTPAF